MDRDVAIKVISGQLADDETFIPRFEREARLIARLQHVHILPVYDFGREEHLLYLVMRLVEGGSLDQRLRDGPLPPAQAAHLFSQIGSALGYAHREGIVHRDIKPSNILLDKNGDPYLMDFGIAKLLGGSSLTATGVAVGTPSYMAPEQWRGGDIDARTDIYALGVMLYEMLTGRLPFQGETPSVLMYKHRTRCHRCPAA
jgi:serine/threonine-protein kinase